MKIKTKKMSYEEAMGVEKPKRKRPKKPNIFFRSLINLASQIELKSVNFTYTSDGTEEIGDEPCLVLMNHSSFIDLEIASKILYPKSFGIVTTEDGFVGKEWLMRSIGCFPAKKFVADVNLISDIRYALKKEKMSVLMYPEASYTFDGCPTPLSEKLGLLFKKLDVPVMMIKTEGAFLRDPLYNGLQKRKVNVSASYSCLFTREDLHEKTAEELDAMLNNAFTFDNFASQYENKISVDENFRCDGLERILYRCPNCCSEGQTEGRGTELICHNCGKAYEMDVYGQLRAKNGETEFSHIPSWFKWEREVVKNQLLSGEYYVDIPVKIGILADYKALMMVGNGRLTHTTEGFTLTGCDGKLNYAQSPLSSYGLYADYFWYEIGDVICIGDKDRRYYCFPEEKVPVARFRFAAEELYKIKKSRLKGI